MVRKNKNNNNKESNAATKTPELFQPHLVIPFNTFYDPKPKINIKTGSETEIFCEHWQ